MIDLIRAINRGIDLAEPKQWPAYGGGLLDRSQYVTSSEIGYCERKVKLDKLAGGGQVEPGVTKTKSGDDWGFWERGHNVEAWVVEQLHRGWESDWELKHTGDDQVSFADGVQSGTPDGIAFSPCGTEFLTVEFKSIDPRTNVSRLPKIPHIDQVTQNTDLIAANTGLSPAGGLILYVDASNYKNRYPFPVAWDQEHAERLEAKAHRIMDTDPKDLKPEGLFKDDCKYCNHTAACSRMIREERNGESYDHDLKQASKGLFG